MDSILITVREALGVDSDYEGFDVEILMGINSGILSLYQLGIGPGLDFKVTGIDELWTDLITTTQNIEAVKSYIHLKAKQTFDPPGTSYLLQALDSSLKELEFRLMAEAEA